MVVSLKHTTQAVGSYTNDGELTTSEWNEEHTLTLGTGNVLGRSAAGTGAAEEISYAALASAAGYGLTANPLSQFAATTSAQLAGVISDETGSGALVFATSPTLVTPALGTPSSGVATNLTGTAAGLTAGSVTTIPSLSGDVTSTGNAVTIAAKAVELSMLADGTDGELITWSATGVAATVPVGTATHVLTSNGAGAAPTFQAPAGGAPEGTAILSTGETGGTKFLREDGDGTSSWQAITGGGDALTTSPLSQFAATTSAQLAGVISDETGSGALVFGTSPTLVTPALGTPSSGVATNLTGTASGLTAGNVTTNANLTGHITSTGNATVLGSFTFAQLNAAISDGSAEPADADILKADTADVLTAAFTATIDDDGTPAAASTYTPSIAAGSNYKRITNSDAFTIAVPTVVSGDAMTLSLIITNDATPGAVTISGSYNAVTGDTPSATANEEFLCRIEAFNVGGTTYASFDCVALQ